MSINIFEGARRIAFLIAVVAAIGTLIALVTHEPYMPVQYSIAHPTAPFVRSEEPCPSEAGKHYFTARTANGKEISVDLCLLAMSFGQAGDRLVPYKVDERGMIWGAPSYSSEVSAYERALERRFKVSPRDEQEIANELSRRYRDNFLSGLGYLAVGLAIFGAIVWAIGWIMRGFLGIPRGMDRRPE